MSLRQFVSVTLAVMVCAFAIGACIGTLQPPGRVAAPVIRARPAQPVLDRTDVYGNPVISAMGTCDLDDDSVCVGAGTVLPRATVLGDPQG